MDCLFLILSLTLLDSVFTENVTATVGDDCELPCICPGDKEVDALDWIHLELGKTLLIYRQGGVLYSQDRVQLKHPRPKNDFSVILKNVTFEDRGIYKCRGSYEDWQKFKLIVFLNIKEKIESITETTNTENNKAVTLRGYRGLILGLLLPLFILLLVLLLKRKKVLCFRRESFRSEKSKKNSPRSESSGSNSAKLLNNEVSELPPHRGGGVCAFRSWDSEHGLTQSSSQTRSSSDPSLQRRDPEAASSSSSCNHTSYYPEAPSIQAFPSNSVLFSINVRF